MIEETRIIMGMPVTLKATRNPLVRKVFDETFLFFGYIDQKYSPFITSSDVSRINAGDLAESDYDSGIRQIINYADKTKKETAGYFDIWNEGTFDPSGIVKGWAIQRASELMAEQIDDFYIDAGGDIQTRGMNDKHQPWRIGVRNPFNRSENIAVVALNNHAIATSGTAIRGQHIYNPLSGRPVADIVSLSVIASNIIDADRMATAAFAMGEQGIEFIESLPGYEAYVVDNNKRATMTTGWRSFEVGSPA